jgi:antitoxin YefM
MSKLLSLFGAIDQRYAKAYALDMPTTFTASEARANFYRLIDQAAESHEPTSIAGKRANAVLIAESDWNAIQETLYLLSIPGMRGSIKQGMATPTKKLSRKLDG